MKICNPQPKQLEFMAATTRYVCYGGARGGGKSHAIRMKSYVMALKYSGINILIVRRTYPELYENHIRPMIEMTVDVAKYVDKSKTLTFVNKSRIKFGYCNGDFDVEQYQGQEYDVLFIDEATHFTEYMFDWLNATVRGVNDFPKRTYLTCNPGGVGHSWVKEKFVNSTRTDSTFIFATVDDNAILKKKDPGYLKMLEALPEGLREAWLKGNWDSFVGQYFRMWNREIHVMEPFEVPSHWRRYRALDYGLDMLAVVWVAIDEDNNAYVYKELHESNLNIYDAAQRIHEVNGDNGINADKIYETLAPGDLFARSQVNGKTVDEMFRSAGVSFTKASNERVAGWQALAEWLRVENIGNGVAGTSRMKVFNNCHNLIRCLPQLQADERNPTDCATRPHEITHVCDALRYFAITYSRKSNPPKKETDPLQAHKQRVLKLDKKRYINDFL